MLGAGWGQTRLEGEGGEVDVAAGEDDADFWRSAIGAGWEIEARGCSWLQERGDGYGAAGLDDDFHAFPDEAHRGDDFFFGDEKDAVEMFAQNREGARGERGAETVGDGVAGVEGLESACGERAVGVVGAGWFAAEDVDVGADAFCGQAGAAEEAAAADGRNNRVDVGDFFEEFPGGCGLAGDDAVVVVGMDERGAGFGLDAGGSLLARSDGWLGECDLATVAFDGAAFYFWRVFGHDDVGGDAAPRGGAGDGGAVIAAGGGDDAVGGFGVGERKNGVGGAANFEGAGLLEIFALEEKLGGGDGVERVGGENWSAMNAPGDARVGIDDVLPGWRLKVR